MHRFLALGLALAFAVVPALPALSLSPSGSYAWSRTELNLRAGPGSQYPTVGTIPAKVAIKALRCEYLWCLVDGPGGQGWADRHSVDFGKNPYWPILDANNVWPDFEGGSMCFYEGVNYTGRSFCAGTGEVFLDLSTWGWDNRIRSIEVVTDTSAAVCRDRDLSSHCLRIYNSVPQLDSLMQRQVSSIRVY